MIRDPPGRSGWCCRKVFFQQPGNEETGPGSGAVPQEGRCQETCSDKEALRAKEVGEFPVFLSSEECGNYPSRSIRYMTLRSFRFASACLRRFFTLGFS